MSFLIRPARDSDIDDLHHLATSLSARGFLTLPSEIEDLKQMITISEKSFGGQLEDPDQGNYLFVMEDLEKGKVVGSSLVIARHGTPESPHLFFQVDPRKKTLKLQWETEGRTELGGLILDPEYRGDPEKLGKRLSYIRLLYIRRHPERFKNEILAELLPPFTVDGKSPLWEALGRKLTGLDYREADRLSRKNKEFVRSCFPAGEIPIRSLPPDAQAIIGVPGPETRPVAKILTEAGFRYLNQVDPFDGGPHYGARREEIRYDLVERFLREGTTVTYAAHCSHG
jgi:arginine N-succinyltransferase